jgi:hypothetical protein
LPVNNKTPIAPILSRTGPRHRALLGSKLRLRRSSATAHAIRGQHRRSEPRERVFNTRVCLVAYVPFSLTHVCALLAYKPFGFEVSPCLRVYTPFRFRTASETAQTLPRQHREIQVPLGSNLCLRRLKPDGASDSRTAPKVRALSLTLVCDCQPAHLAPWLLRILSSLHTFRFQVCPSLCLRDPGGHVRFDFF